MIEKKTVLVLGAGASKDYGFPLGKELVKEICDNIYPNSVWVNTLPLVGIEPKLALRFRESLCDLRPLSADAFLEDRRNLEYADACKAASALALMNHEIAASLEAWDGLYITMYHRMETQPERFVASASNLTFVTFNYDRSLEYFFWARCLAMAHRNQQQAMDLYKQVRIIHVYGLLGIPDFLCDDPADRRCYAYSEDISNLKACMRNMHIITEQPQNTALNFISQNPLRSAEIVCFLGFGYAPSNVLKLQIPHEWYREKKTYGTAFGLSANQKAEVSQLFDNAIELGELGQYSKDFLNSKPIL